MPNKKLLIVDDDLIERTLLSKQLLKHGFEVQTAEDGVHALEEFKKSPYDLALIDLMMPRMNGLELLEKLKEINPNIPAIIITANDEIDSYIRVKEQGAYEYIIKPVNIELLKQMIVSVLNAK